MSVFELSGLQKLRRIGLVRVHNLTDHAIYSLAERHATLERIHLSYCDQITVRAIHFLLQKLPKLTHLSLTGVPDFRRPELQKFCRDAPAVRVHSMMPCKMTFLPVSRIYRSSIPNNEPLSAFTQARAYQSFVNFLSIRIMH